MKKLPIGIYDVTDKAALAAQRMGWSALYLSLLWLGVAIADAVGRALFRRGN